MAVQLTFDFEVHLLPHYIKSGYGYHFRPRILHCKNRVCQNSCLGCLNVHSSNTPNRVFLKIKPPFEGVTGHPQNTLTSGSESLNGLLCKYLHSIRPHKLNYKILILSSSSSRCGRAVFIIYYGRWLDIIEKTLGKPLLLTHRICPLEITF